MNVLDPRFRSILVKTTLAALALGGALCFATVPAARANDWDDCNRRTAYTNWRYNEAVEHFGPYSREARHWAHERHEAERVEHHGHEWREHHGDRDDYYRDRDRR